MAITPGGYLHRRSLLRGAAIIAGVQARDRIRRALHRQDADSLTLAVASTREAFRAVVAWHTLVAGQPAWREPLDLFEAVDVQVYDETATDRGAFVEGSWVQPDAVSWHRGVVIGLAPTLPREPFPYRYDVRVGDLYLAAVHPDQVRPIRRERVA